MIWLIVLAVFFSKAFVSSGLGDRVATYFVSLFGGSSLGLGYGLALSEALIAPAMPSTTARASIYVPLVDSLAAQQGSYSLAKDPSGASARRLGAFLSLGDRKLRPLSSQARRRGGSARSSRSATCRRRCTRRLRR